MAWVEPKTTWVSTDYFNKEDYNRIIGNCEFLSAFAEKLFKLVELIPKEEKTYQSMIYADDFNDIEANVESLYKETYGILIEVKSFSPNGATVNWVELNRIERLILELREKIETQYSLLQKFAFGLNKQFIGSKQSYKVATKEAGAYRLSYLLGAENNKGGIF